MSVAPKKLQTISDPFPIVSQVFFYSSCAYALSSPFLSCPCLRESYLEFTRRQTPSSEGSASVSVWNFSICSEHRCTVYTGLVSKWDVWFELITWQGSFGGSKQFTHSQKVLGLMFRPFSVQFVCCSCACVGLFQVSGDYWALPMM